MIPIVVCGDKLNYEIDSSFPSANMLESKLLFNSVISDPSKRAQLYSLDLKDVVLHTSMKHPEYMKLHFKYFPEDICQK